MGNAKYAFFWGCTIPARLPFMEKSTRLVLDALEVEYTDLAGFTCCPEKSLFETYNEREWILTAARNLAIAEKAGLDIVAACNGCYGTLKSVANRLDLEPALKEWVNQGLATIGLEYKGLVHVKHLMEILHDEVGPSRIRARVEKPLSGMRIAVHPGCHMVRPSSAIHFDDPLNPVKFDALVEALGAKSVPYHTKMMCCGGALSNVGELEDSMALARKKLLELQRIGVDAMTLICPACFMQFDQKQYMAQRQGEHLHIPVLTYPELVGLAMGMSPADLGLSSHRVDTTSFFKTWDNRLVHFNEVKRHLDLASVRRCYECGACVSDCPVAEIVDLFKPNELIGQLLEGKIEELLKSKAIWYCVECHTCYELCPQKFGMEKVFTTLKHLAMKQGLMPSPVKGGLDMFFKSGRLGAPDERNRKKLGLEPLPSGGGEQLAKLLALTREKPE